MMENEWDENVNDDDNDGDDDVDLEKNLISAGGKPVASGSVGADVGSLGMAALIQTAHCTTGNAQAPTSYCTTSPETGTTGNYQSWTPGTAQVALMFKYLPASATANCLQPPPQTIAEHPICLGRLQLVKQISGNLIDNCSDW